MGAPQRAGRPHLVRKRAHARKKTTHLSDPLLFRVERAISTLSIVAMHALQTAVQKSLPTRLQGPTVIAAVLVTQIRFVCSGKETERPALDSA